MVGNCNCNCNWVCVWCNCNDLHSIQLFNFDFNFNFSFGIKLKLQLLPNMKFAISIELSLLFWLVVCQPASQPSNQLVKWDYSFLFGFILHSAPVWMCLELARVGWWKQWKEKEKKLARQQSLAVCLHGSDLHRIASREQVCVCVMIMIMKVNCRWSSQQQVGLKSLAQNSLLPPLAHTNDKHTTCCCQWKPLSYAGWRVCRPVFAWLRPTIKLPTAARQKVAYLLSTQLKPFGHDCQPANQPADRFVCDRWVCVCVFVCGGVSGSAHQSCLHWSGGPTIAGWLHMWVQDSLVSTVHDSQR